MKKNKRLLYTLGNIPEKYIDEAISEKARKMKTQWKYIITAAACFVVIAAVPVYIMKKSPNQNGSNNNGDITVTEVSEVTSESQTSVSTAQTEQTESTPQKEMIFAGTGPEKASDYKPDSMNSSAGNFDFKDGYFVVSFLKDKEFEERINADIREATDSLQPYFDEKYLENAHLSADANSWENLDNTHGLTIYPNCCNGYLSIVIGYAYLMTNEDLFLTNKSYEHVITLNYDLFEKKKIEKFSDLFYNGEDILSLVNENLTYYIENFSLLGTQVQKKKFDGLTELPELFTIDSIIFSADNPFFNAAPEIYFDSNQEIYDHMITGKYRDMRNIVDDNLCEAYDNPYFEWDIKTKKVKEDNITAYYKEITGSRFHTQEEINEYQNLNDKLQHIAVEYYTDNYDPEDLPNTFSKSDTGYDINVCDFSIEPNKLLNNVYTVFNLDLHSINIDTETYKILSLSEILKKDLKPDDWGGTMETDNRDSRNVDINSYTHLKEWFLSTNMNYDALSLSFNVDDTYLHGKLKDDGVNPDYLNEDYADIF